MTRIRLCRRWEITAAEWRWWAGVSLLILALSCLPYLAGYRGETAGRVFGGMVFDRTDYAQHMARVIQGWRGEWQVRLLATAEPHQPGTIYTLYLALGHLARLTGLTPAAAYQAGRLLLGALALLSAYLFLAFLIRPVALRRTAFIFFGLGSGLGWLQLLTGWVPQPDISPIDFWLMDAYGFFSLHTFPHFVALMALSPLIVQQAAQFMQDGRPGRLLAAALAAVCLQLIHPFLPASADLALTGYVVWRALRRRALRRREAGALAVLAVSQLPMVVYGLRLFQSGVVWFQYRTQAPTLSPPPVYYVLGFGLIGPLAVWGIALALRGRRSRWLLAAAWVILPLAMTYAPLDSQRRFLMGMPIPLGALAAIGLGYGLLPRLHRVRWVRGLVRRGFAWRRLRNLLLAATASLASLSTWYLILGGAQLAAGGDPDLFDPPPVVAAVDWLGQTSDWPATILASEQTGTLILSRIAHRVYLGHFNETVDYRLKVSSVAAFFDAAGMDDPARRSLLLDCGCAFVFVGPYERSLGNWEPASAPFLSSVYHNEQVAVYRFVP